MGERGRKGAKGLVAEREQVMEAGVLENAIRKKKLKNWREMEKENPDFDFVQNVSFIIHCLKQRKATKIKIIAEEGRSSQ